MTIKRLEGSIEDLLIKAASNIVELRPELARAITLQMVTDADNHGINVMVVHVWARLYRKDVTPEIGYLVRLARGESRPPEELSMEFAEYYWEYDELLDDDDELAAVLDDWYAKHLH